MNFAEPTYLFGFLLLLPLGLLVWRAERRRKSLLTRLGDLPLMARLTETVNENGRKWASRLWFVALGLLLVALARPQWGSETQLVQQEGVQVMVVLDVSTSMLADDLRPSRLAQAKQSMVELMAALDGDEVGLVLFSGASFIQFPLTTDYGTARSFLDAAGPNAISRGGSVLGQAIETAVSGFNLQRDSQRVVVVMTDGESHEGNPIEAATEAAEADVIIYTIGFGSPEGEAVPQLDSQGRVVGSRLDSQGNVILSRLDEATLQGMAEVANGRYFRATAGGQEIEALADEINQLQAAQLESRFQTQRIERFQLFLGAAIMLLILMTLIPERKTAVLENEEAAVEEARLSRRAEQGEGKKPRFTPINKSTNLLILLLLFAGCTPTPTPADQINSGNAAYDSGEYESALTDYQEAIAALPETAEPIYNSANALFRNEQLAEAQAQMDVALLDADDALAADAYFNLGNFYYSQQDYVNAIEAYKSGLRLNPDDADAKHNLELALMQQQQEGGGEDEQEQEEEQENDEGEEEQEEPDESDEPQEEEQPEEEETGEDESEEPQEQEQEQEQAGGDQDENAEETPPEEPADPEENSNSQQPPVEGLTEEQAYQLLEAIGQQTETLQEFLQEQFTAPGGPPERDW